MKDDQRQLRSITTSLQAPIRLKFDKLLSHFVIDINEVGGSYDGTVCHEESSDSNESVFEDEHYLSEDENLTDPN